MTEKELIKIIIDRIGRKVYYEEEDYIEFEGCGCERVSIDFDENGFVVDIY